MRRLRRGFTVLRLMGMVAAVGLCLAAFRANFGLGLLALGFCGLAYRAESEEQFYRWLLKALIGYCVVGSLTLPFVDWLWLGEVPPLALVQFPKLPFADWLRSGIVMEAIKALGHSRGSFSPDYILARPYALAIAYLVPLGVLLATLWARRRQAGPCRRLVLMLVCASLIDYMVTLWFGSQRFITLY